MQLLKMLFPALLTIARSNSTLVRSAAERVSSFNNQLYSIRQASVDDIPSINACNRETLPENYEHDFFLRHLT